MTGTEAFMSNLNQLLEQTEYQILNYQQDAKKSRVSVGSISLLDQIQVIPLQQIATAGGDVWHALKSSEDSFIGFGEAYFSWWNPEQSKAWKQHLHMTMNLIVPIGTVRFIFYELGNNSFREERIGTFSYARLTVPPRIWFGFQGLFQKHRV